MPLSAPLTLWLRLQRWRHQLTVPQFTAVTGLLVIASGTLILASPLCSTDAVGDDVGALLSRVSGEAKVGKRGEGGGRSGNAKSGKCSPAGRPACLSRVRLAGLPHHAAVACMHVPHGGTDSFVLITNDLTWQ
jgi:hypothetical protein